MDNEMHTLGTEKKLRPSTDVQVKLQIMLCKKKIWSVQPAWETDDFIFLQAFCFITLVVSR
jgi:hypothetical protein